MPRTPKKDDLTKWETTSYLDSTRNTPPRLSPQWDIQRIKALEAENARLREALKAAQEWLNEMGCEHDEENPDKDCVVCIVNAAIAAAEKGA